MQKANKIIAGFQNQIQAQNINNNEIKKLKEKTVIEIIKEEKPVVVEEHKEEKEKEKIEEVKIDKKDKISKIML